MKRLLKILARGVCIIFAFPFAVLAGFGRFQGGFTLFAQLFALGPGVIGDYLRTAYYWWTLRRCSLETRIAFGTFFVTREATIEPLVVIGAYCVLGHVHIGRHTLMGSHVQVLSGTRQHIRDRDGHLQNGTFSEVRIGPECWIGSSAVIAAEVGAGATV